MNGSWFRIEPGVGSSGHVTLDNSLAAGAGDTLKADCVKFSCVGAIPTAARDWTHC